MSRIFFTGMATCACNRYRHSCISAGILHYKEIAGLARNDLGAQSRLLIYTFFTALDTMLLVPALSNLMVKMVMAGELLTDNTTP